MLYVPNREKAEDEVYIVKREWWQSHNDITGPFESLEGAKESGNEKIFPIGSIIKIIKREDIPKYIRTKNNREER